MDQNETGKIILRYWINVNSFHLDYGYKFIESLYHK